MREATEEMTQKVCTAGSALVCWCRYHAPSALQPPTLTRSSALTSVSTVSILMPATWKTAASGGRAADPDPDPDPPAARLTSAAMSASLAVSATTASSVQPGVAMMSRKSSVQRSGSRVTVRRKWRAPFSKARRTILEPKPPAAPVMR